MLLTIVNFGIMSSRELVETSGSNKDAPKKVSRLSKQKSVMEITNNPFQVAAASDPTLHVEKINDARLISPTDFEDYIVGPLMTTSVNEERIELLEKIRLPYLFTSEQLCKLCELQTSLKTKLRYIELCGPRLIDPAAKTLALTDMFRFNGEKQQVELVLKTRSEAIAKTMFTTTTQSGGGSILAGRGGSAGRGGRGRRSWDPVNNSVSSAPPVDAMQKLSVFNVENQTSVSTTATTDESAPPVSPAETTDSPGIHSVPTRKPFS